MYLLCAGAVFHTIYWAHYYYKLCQKADEVNFIKFWLLIKSPQPFFYSSAEPKITDFWRFLLESARKAYGEHPLFTSISYSIGT